MPKSFFYITRCPFPHFLVAAPGSFCFVQGVTAAPPLSPTDRFAGLIEGLYQVVAALSYRGQVEGWLIGLICARLRRLGARFARIVERARAGTLPAPTAVRPGQRPAVDRPSASRLAAPPPEHSLPTGFAWLIRLGGYKTAAYGSLLQHLLADPEMAALIVATPRLGRVLRPLCQCWASTPAPLGCRRVRAIRKRRAGPARLAGSKPRRGPPAFRSGGPPRRCMTRRAPPTIPCRSGYAARSERAAP